MTHMMLTVMTGNGFEDSSGLVLKGVELMRKMYRVSQAQMIDSRAIPQEDEASLDERFS